MEWLKAYWWVILVILIGMFINGIKALNRTSFKSYLAKKPSIKPVSYDDDDDDWEIKNNSTKSAFALESRQESTRPQDSNNKPK